jgi:hypothetical protein
LPRERLGQPRKELGLRGNGGYLNLVPKSIRCTKGKKVYKSNDDFYMVKMTILEDSGSQ